MHLLAQSLLGEGAGSKIRGMGGGEGYDRVHHGVVWKKCLLDMVARCAKVAACYV